MALRANDSSFKADEYPNSQDHQMKTEFDEADRASPRISKPNHDFSERSTASHLISNFSRNYSLQKNKLQVNHFTEDSGRERDTAATFENKSSFFQTRLNSLPANDLPMRSTFNNFTYKGEPYVIQ